MTNNNKAAATPINKTVMSKRDGMVLVTILSMVIIMTILALSVLNTNLSQVTSTEDQIKQVKSEIIAKSIMSYMYALQQKASPANTGNLNFTLDDIKYQGQGKLDNKNDGINDTRELNIDVTY